MDHSACSGIARVGPTTPTRVGRFSDASGDQTDARKATGSRVYRRRTTATPQDATGVMADVSVFPLL
jgi:hypothetical protein